APRAWEDFVDRFLGLVVHVARHTCQTRGLPIDRATQDDLVAEVFLAIVRDDYAVLRRFRRNSSLATYLTVIARRVIVRRLIASMRQQSRSEESHAQVNGNGAATHNAETVLLEDREEVERLMVRLDPQEANVVRMYHLEGKSYQEISQEIGLAENSIGPVLSRARAKMRSS
ncbi:MAG: sigma-70 family RNA polymerase sigma factor, partial [Planctomycetota bacterium]